MARAPDSKSGCWGFESLLACQSNPERNAKRPLESMKKVKSKKGNGTEPQTEIAVKEDGPAKDPEIPAAPKTKTKTSLKKPSLKEEPVEGLAARWAGKNQWIGQVKDFFREVRIELKKVTWPSRKETIAATVMVVFLSVLVAFFLGLLDIGLAKAVGTILKRS
jgi:preprotein translocase subunit SecE